MRRSGCPLPAACVVTHTTPHHTLGRVQAEQLLSSGKAKYEGGDRMGALRLWEQALQQVRVRMGVSAPPAACRLAG